MLLENGLNDYLLRVDSMGIFYGIKMVILYEIISLFVVILYRKNI